MSFPPPGPPARRRPAARWWLALASLAGWGGWWQAAQRAGMPPPAPQPVAATAAPGGSVPPPPAPVRQPPTRSTPVAPQTDVADCVASLSPSVRLRNAAAAASAAGHDGTLRPLLARIENEDRRALEAGTALHAAAVAGLRTSADPATRAVGLQLAAMPQPGGRTDCRRDDCDAELRAAWQQAQPRLADLAMLALGSHDGEIYARAWAACQRVGPMAADVPACSQLSAQRWAQLAPDTAAPWLTLAAQARAAGDAAGELTAMHRAALASRWHRPAGGLMRALLAQSAPSPSDPMARWHADWHALSAELQGADLDMAPMLQFCAAPLDSNRRQICHQLAGHMLAAPEDLLQLTFALHLGHRAGWPAEQLAAHRHARDALMAASAIHATQWMPPDHPGAWQPVALCTGLAAMRQHLLRWAEGGELAALRALLTVPGATAPTSPAVAASASVQAR